MDPDECFPNRPVWDNHAYPDDGPVADRLRLSYQRARSLVQLIRMSVDDIAQLRPKFWAFHSHFVVSGDTAATTILTIHWNLCMGTIASYVAQRPDLHGVLQELERFDSCGEFMLTEVGHGLDARNIETTATLNPDGSFDLHTPGPSAAKIMPPTSPFALVPRIAVVFARLVVGGKKLSVRPFLVRINDVDNMAPGITCRLLPARPGAKVLDHSITTFNHVRLEASSLLGDAEEPKDARLDFLHQIRRVTVGTLSLSMTNIPTLRLSGYILGRYSQQRHVSGVKPGERVPIISFATQHAPILTALSTSIVLEAYANETVKAFLHLGAQPQVQAALACAFKQTAIRSCQPLLNEMIDRCGWQGLYSHNQIIEFALSQRGNSIAEGDITVLCIRLASELLMGRYNLPKPRNPTSLLARHEAGLWDEAKKVVEALPITSSHRSEEFNSQILPRCGILVLATGQRMAYEAAFASGVKPEVLKLYESVCILDNASWFVEHAGFSRSEIFKCHADAVRELLPSLEAMLQETQADPWATAPFLSQERWEKFVDGLTLFTNPNTEHELSRGPRHQVETKL